MDDPETTIRVPQSLRERLKDLIALDRTHRGAKFTQAEKLEELIEMEEKKYAEHK